MEMTSGKMPYSSVAISIGQRAHELLLVELRIRLANEVLRRVGVRGAGAGLHICIADVSTANVSALLGEFWLIFGHKERRRLATAGDNFDFEMVKVALEAGGVGPTVDGALMRINAESCGLNQLHAAQYDARRAAIERAIERARAARP